MPEAACGSLAAQASQVFNAELAAAQRQQDQYDIDTGHGRTQGAVLGGLTATA